MVVDEDGMPFDEMNCQFKLNSAIALLVQAKVLVNTRLVFPFHPHQDMGGSRRLIWSFPAPPFGM